MDKLSRVAITLEKIQLDEHEVAPPWAKILINCLSDLVGAVRDFNKLHERVVELESIKELRGKVIESLQNENSNLKKEITLVRQVADTNEQKSRTQCLLLHGIDESTAENTDDIAIKVISEHLGVDISINDIERTHRIALRKKQPGVLNLGRSLYGLRVCERDSRCLGTKRNLRVRKF